MGSGVARIGACVGILAILSLLYGVRATATWSGGRFFEYLTNWWWTCLLLWISATVACFTVLPVRHWVLGIGEPVIVAWSVMVWLTITLVLSLGDESALDEAREKDLSTGEIMSAEKATHTVPFLLVIAFCALVGADRFRQAKGYLNEVYGPWPLPIVWTLILASIFLIYLASFTPENVYQTSIEWPIIAPISSIVTLCVLVVFYFV